ncbi:MAG: aminomethyltransferase family protein [Acidobacteria bacterium]|nr:aminomethyltransferase family protein [Acidobacteriota bacterium]
MSGVSEQVGIGREALLEYAAVREGGAGLLDLGARGRVLVSGSEAVQFLNGLITNDVKALGAGAWMQAAFPNAQGRLLAHVRVLHVTEGFLFDTEAATREVVLKTLSRFTLAGDFRVTELTDEMTALSLQGAGALELIRRVLGEEAARVEQGRVAEVDWNGRALKVIRATHTGEDGFDIFVSGAEGEAVRDALTEAGAVVVGAEALETLRIEAGLPLYGVDVDESNVVLEAAQDEAVSYTKGCYIGQEIIARIHWRGHVAKRLAGVVLDEGGSTRREDRVCSADGKEIGRITSAAFSPRLKRFIGLGLIRYDYLRHGTEALVVSDETEQKAHISDLPLVRGSWQAQSESAPEKAV